MMLFPHDPAAVHVIYRSPMGDIEAFPVINALAAGNWGENAVYESWGTGVMSFSIPSLFPQVLGTALLGNYWGYIAADIFVTLAFFLLFRAWCRLFSASEGWANFIAAIFASGLPEIYVYLGQIWGQRLPRPFVNNLYFIMGIAFLVWMIWKPERWRAWLPWSIIGLILALSLQGSVYYIPAFFMAITYIVVIWVMKDFREMPLVVGRLGCALGIFVILDIPFLIQGLMESPDAMGRFGVFPVDRWSIWANPVWRDTDGAFLFGMYCLMMLALFNLFARQLKLPVLPWRVLGLLAVLQIGALLALPLTAMLTGKLVQPYHFIAVSHYMETCMLVAWVSYVGGGLIPRLAIAPFLAGGLLAWSFYVVTVREIVADHSLGHLRPDIYTPPGPDYHDALTKLARELDKDSYRDDRVVATTDHEIYVYWVGFHHGFAFLPDSFTTTLSNHEIEDRLLWFAREGGLGAGDLTRFLDQKAIMLFWLEHDRYQCSPLYQKASLSDYSPEDIVRNFDHPPDLGSFALALPKGDLARLQDRYAQILAQPEMEKPRLDLIILTTDLRQFPLPGPNPARYKLTYHDAYFQIWKARKDLP